MPCEETHSYSLRTIIALVAMSHSPSFETSSDTKTTSSSDSYDIDLTDASSNVNSSPPTAELPPTSTQLTPPALPRSSLRNSQIPYFFRLAFWIWLLLSGMAMLASTILFLTSSCHKINKSGGASHSTIPQSQCVYDDSMSTEAAIAVFLFLGLFVGVPVLVISFILPCVVGYLYTASRPEAPPAPASRLTIPVLFPSKPVVEDEESALFAEKM